MKDELRPAAARGIVPDHRHAAGALITLGLPLGGAQRASLHSWTSALAARPGSRKFPAFFAFALLSSIGQLSVFTSDVIPSVTPETFWYVDWSNLSVESILKFLVIGAVFGRVFNPYPSVSKLGKILVSGVGAVLVFIATLTAAFSRGDSPVRLLAGAHLLELSTFIVECGLILFIFLFARLLPNAVGS